MSKAKSKSLTKVLLVLLDELGESTIDLIKLWSAISSHYGSAYVKGGGGYVAELNKFHKLYYLKRKLSELERRRYISIKKGCKKFSIALTDKGRSYNEARSWKSFKQHKSGWYTVVIFDIPELMASQRRQWRALLRVGGFSKLQLSVWISKNDCYHAVAEFIKSNKVDRWVNVYHATNFLNRPK
jgi:PaaX protein central Cas2-like domain